MLGVSATRITATERPVGVVFGDDYQFEIPRYQRPYAWTTEQGGEMFDDLLGASQAASAKESADPYFLGSLVLVKGDGQPKSEVVDGQQRLTTLTILLGTLRHHVSEAFADALDRRIFQKGDPLTKKVDQPRLLPRERDREFFEQHVQSRGGMLLIGSIAVDALSDSRKNIVENALLFDTRLSNLDESECEQFAGFIINDTYLVVVATQDFDSAYRIFAVLNERGLDLTHTDILKSEIIGSIDELEQDLYTKKWETEEEDLGRDGFADLFAHIRMVYAKTKARESILKEFRALRYLRDPTVTTQDALAFLTDLERLAASMLLRRVDITKRIERYGILLSAIEDGSDLYADESPLQLDESERDATKEKLRAHIYTVTRVRLYVLLRLDSALSGGGATYDYPVLTVEHVLPQSPRDGSVWREWFTDDQREYWTHKLASLLLLTQRKNSQASNYEFDEKKEKYFTSSAGGVSPFVLTTQVLAAKDWTPERLARRQNELTSALADLWRL